MGTACWDADPAKRPGIDHVLRTLEMAAEEWKPKSGELSSLSHRDDRGTTVSEGASGHRPEISELGALGPDSSGAQARDTPQTLDETMDQILAGAKPPVREGEARGVIEALETVWGDHLKRSIGESNSCTQKLKSCHGVDLGTNRRYFRRLVEICGEHSMLPDSCTIPEAKLQKQGDSHVSFGGSSLIWRGVYMEHDDGKLRDVAIKVMRYSRDGNVQQIRKVSHFRHRIRTIV